ncbi:hypothetical protein JW933_12030 [candidate division FCPU426 bacterium]|nr:hypothetical protein [candidate division FCPU426 bacterium]
MAMRHNRGKDNKAVFSIHAGAGQQQAGAGEQDYTYDKNGKYLKLPAPRQYARIKKSATVGNNT